MLRGLLYLTCEMKILSEGQECTEDRLDLSKRQKIGFYQKFFLRQTFNLAFSEAYISTALFLQMLCLLCRERGAPELQLCTWKNITEGRLGTQAIFCHRGHCK